MRYRATLAVLSVLAAGVAGCGQPGKPPAVSAAPADGADAQARALGEMRRLATIASAVLDGDECMEIVTDRAAELMFKVDPRDKWIGSDNYDVDREKFTRTKKLLIRVSRLADFPVDCNLWLRTKQKPWQVHAVILQVNGLSSFYQFGQMVIDPPEEFAGVLKEGRTVAVTGKRRSVVSVLAPVRNSLGDVVGLVEVASRVAAAGGP